MKNSCFKVLFHYLKNDKLRLFLYIFLVVITQLPYILSPVLWGFAAERIVHNDLTGFIICLSCWSGSYIFFYGILQIPRDNLYDYLEIKFTKNVSKDLYQKIDKLPARAFEEVGVGEFVNRLYTDPDRIMELLQRLIRLFCRSSAIVMILILSFSISLLLALEIIIFSFIMGFISWKFFPKIKQTQEKIKKESDNYVKVATENISGIREIKSLGIKNIIEKNIFKTIDDLFFHSSKIRKYRVLYYSLNNLVFFTLQFIILFTAGYYVVHGKIAYSVFIMLETYLWKIDQVVESISDFGVSYNKVKISLIRIGEILDNKLYDDEKFGSAELKNVEGRIKFENVKFKYSPEEDYTLRGLSVNFEPHQKIAIVGRSGNGKSTIFNLLLRYFDATSGKISIDNVNIEDLTEESLRKNISIIRQSPFLFNLSIMDNFRLTKDDVTLKEVRECCKRAYIDDYIMSLPNEYETIIGEGGINLSGGQKQRLAIARTLLLNSKIVLFDEATSALDNESQDYIKKTIDSLVKDHTVIIVAHRLSTIVDADVINVIEKGTLVASGSHKELLKHCSEYQTLYKNESSN